MRLRVAVLAATALVASALGQAVEPVEDALSDLPRVRFPEPGRIVSGAIDARHIEALKRAGIRHVVNLRPVEENPGFDEVKVVTEHGLRYHAIAIHGPQSLTKQNVEEFDRVLAEIDNEPALIHCSSGNRVGAMIALREGWMRGASVQEAIELGKRWGLGALEAPVKALLQERKDAAKN
jgi:uncharacterized protein (TIGR01244 family)